jgi:hypothetical protein
MMADYIQSMIEVWMTMMLIKEAERAAPLLAAMTPTFGYFFKRWNQVGEIHNFRSSYLQLFALVTLSGDKSWPFVESI